MASGPITSWEIDGETVSDFILGGSKITTDGDCNHEIKRRLLLGLLEFNSLLWELGIELQPANTLLSEFLGHVFIAF